MQNVRCYFCAHQVVKKSVAFFSFADIYLIGYASAHALNFYNQNKDVGMNRHIDSLESWEIKLFIGY